VKVFVINLKDATERRESAELQLSKLKIDYEIFEAIDKNDDPSSHFTRINYFSYLIECSFFPSTGEIACYASHLALWKRCVLIGEPITILEDDFIASDAFADALKFLEPYGNKLGFIRLESMSYKNMSRNKLTYPAHINNGTFSLHAIKNKMPFHSTGYILSPKVAQSLITRSKTLLMPVDHVFQRNWAYGDALYTLNPPVIHLSDHSSDSQISGRKKLPVIRHLTKPFRILNRYFLRRKTQKATY
jgi:glycosyl transferase family 25